MHILGRIRHVSSAVALGAALAAVLMAGCGSSVQREATCPGDTCTRELQRVSDAVAALPGVVGVDRVTSLVNADRGGRGSVSARVDVSDQVAARSLAGQVGKAYYGGGAQGVDTVTVTLTPVAAEPVASVHEASLASAGSAPACAATQCADELDAFRAGWPGQTPALSEAELQSVTWDDSTARPTVRLHVTAPRAPMDAAQIDAFTQAVLAHAQEQGLAQLGSVAVKVAFHSVASWTFTVAR